jgi:hypothetical protein
MVTLPTMGFKSNEVCDLSAFEKMDWRHAVSRLGVGRNDIFVLF